MYKVGEYTSDDLMCDLICNNYTMLLVLNRFGIALGFGDSTIGTVCSKYNIDVNTFLAIVNLHISGGKSSPNLDKTKISLSSLVTYLHNSHSYFLDYKLASIREKLINSLTDINSAVSKAIINYYDEYVEEVRNHMLYEEEKVFPYINSLINGEINNKYKIDTFRRHHSNIESKLFELKNILIKYYPAETTNQLSSVLFDIFSCESDLASHNNIEDYILVPTIKLLESTK